MNFMQSARVVEKKLKMILMRLNDYLDLGLWRMAGQFHSLTVETVEVKGVKKIILNVGSIYVQIVMLKLITV